MFEAKLYNEIPSVNACDLKSSEIDNDPKCIFLQINYLSIIVLIFYVVQEEVYTIRIKEGRAGTDKDEV